MDMIIAKVPEKKSREYTKFHQYKKYIGISWINTYFYCPYQLYLQKVKKIEAKPTVEIEAGIKAHKVKEINHEIQVEEEISVETALEKSKDENKSYRFRELGLNSEFKKYQLGGRIDELVVYPNRLEIIDDKPGEIVYKGAKMQVLGYALAFRERFGQDREIKAIVRSITTQKILSNVTFTNLEAKQIKEALEEIYLLLKDVVIPEITPTKNKCKKCRYIDVCEYHL